MAITQLLLLATLYSWRISAQTESNSPSSQCELIQVAMCKGLTSYNATKLPNKFGHWNQAQVYWALQPWWPFMDAGCSDNLRTFLCGLYLPRCVPEEPQPQYPCKETCNKAKLRCKKQMRQEKLQWSRVFKCQQLLPKASQLCIKPERERRKKGNKQYVLCQPNNLPMCRGIPFPQASLPNMFLQSDLREIEQEMQQFQTLVDSGCSKKLALFLCGVYMPFCVPGSHLDHSTDQQVVIHSQPDVPFVVPCRELCQEVYDQCSGEYQQRTQGLPWPGKFHCHRYPSYVDHYNNSTMHQPGSHVPCTMPPYNYAGH